MSNDYPGYGANDGPGPHSSGPYGQGEYNAGHYGSGQYGQGEYGAGPYGHGQPSRSQPIQGQPIPGQYGQPQYGGPAAGAPMPNGAAPMPSGSLRAGVPLRAPHPPEAYGAGSEVYWQADSNERNMGGVFYLVSAFLAGFIMPIIGLSMYKDSSPFVREHSRQLLNMWLTFFVLFIAYLVVWGTLVGIVAATAASEDAILWVGPPGAVLAYLFPLVVLIVQIVGCVKAFSGKGFHPWSIPFVRR